MRHLLGQQVKTIVFDPMQDVAGARQDAEIFLQNHPPPLFLDEVQYAPGLVVCATPEPTRLAPELFAIPWWRL